MIGFRKTQSSILGLSLQERHLRVVQMRRHESGNLEVEKRLVAELELDPLSEEPVKAGARLRHALEEAGIGESRCALALPTAWALSAQIELPALEGEDLEAYIQTQAERLFPLALTNLVLSTCQFVTPDNHQYASLIGIPCSNIERLEHMLTAAGLQPVTFSVEAAKADGRNESAVVLSLGEKQVELSVRTAGKTAMLRSLELTDVADTDAFSANSRRFAREIRLTLGQLPEGTAGPIESVTVFGANGKTDRWVEELTPLLQRFSLKTVPGETFLPAEQQQAQRWLSGQSAEFEFLPKRLSRWQTLQQKFSSGKTFWLGGGTAAVVLLLSVVFLWQGQRVASMEQEWNSIRNDVAELEALQSEIKLFRPWFNNDIVSLNIMRVVTEAFPVEGFIWLTNFQIKDPWQVSCSGYAQDRKAVLSMLERLRESEQIKDLKLRQLEGEDKMQFAVQFEWQEGR